MSDIHLLPPSLDPAPSAPPLGVDPDALVVAAKNDLIAAALAIAGGEDAQTALRLAEARLLRAARVRFTVARMFSAAALDDARTRRRRLLIQNVQMRAALARHNDELASVSAKLAAIADLGRAAFLQPATSILPAPATAGAGAGVGGSAPKKGSQ